MRLGRGGTLFGGGGGVILFRNAPIVLGLIFFSVLKRLREEEKYVCIHRVRTTAQKYNILGQASFFFLWGSACS